MIFHYLSYQLRQGLFLIPLITIPVLLLTNNYLFVFFILQTRFYKIFQQTDFPLQLLNVTGADLGNLLKGYNLSWVVWFNAWFILAQIIHLFVNDLTFIAVLTQQINFNIFLFVGFIVGNCMSNSDLITIRSGFLRLLSASFVFGMSISITYMILQICLFLNQSFLISMLLLAGVIFTWHYLIKQQNRINYLSYYV